MTAVLTREVRLDVPAPARVEVVAPRRPDFDDDIVEQWGLDSFPASDPPANW